MDYCPVYSIGSDFIAVQVPALPCVAARDCRLTPKSICQFSSGLFDRKLLVTHVVHGDYMDEYSSII